MWISLLWHVFLPMKIGNFRTGTNDRSYPVIWIVETRGVRWEICSPAGRRYVQILAGRTMVGVDRHVLGSDTVFVALLQLRRRLSQFVLVVSAGRVIGIWKTDGEISVFLSNGENENGRQTSVTGGVAMKETTVLCLCVKQNATYRTPSLELTISVSRPCDWALCNKCQSYIRLYPCS